MRFTTLKENGRWGRLAAALLFLAAALSPAHAQVQSTGSVGGVVHDTNGAAVPGVRVRVSNPATGLARDTTTDGEGRYSVTVLPTGTYEVTFARDGFTTSAVANVVVEAAALWRHAWGEEKPYNGESLHVHIYRLRLKLAPRNVRIETMVNVGYCLLSEGAANGDFRAGRGRLFRDAS